MFPPCARRAPSSVTNFPLLVHVSAKTIPFFFYATRFSTPFILVLIHFTHTSTTPCPAIIVHYHAAIFLALSALQLIAYPHAISPTTFHPTSTKLPIPGGAPFASMLAPQTNRRIHPLNKPTEKPRHQHDQRTGLRIHRRSMFFLLSRRLRRTFPGLQGQRSNRALFATPGCIRAPTRRKCFYLPEINKGEEY